MQIDAQAAPIVVHYHSAVWIWMFFVVGEILHFALQIDESARLSKLSRASIAWSGAIRFAFRGFFCALVFGLIWLHPEIFAKLAATLGHPVGKDEDAVIALPMNNPLAGIYGICLDSLLGYVPGLKSLLPQAEQWDGSTDRRGDGARSATKPIPPWPDMSKPLP